jgi:Protein of unknown function (DUF2585)
VLCALLAFIAARLSLVSQLWFAASIEVLWEVVENSEFVIRRYHPETAALGNHGDTVINWFSDINACGLGVVLDRNPKTHRILVLLLVAEVTLVFRI